MAPVSVGERGGEAVNDETDVTVNPYTLEGMIARVKLLPGVTLYPPHLDALGDREEVAIKIAEATGTILEWNEGGSPRFMPADEDMAGEIRNRWRACGLDTTTYAPPGWGPK